MRGPRRGHGDSQYGEEEEEENEDDIEDGKSAILSGLLSQKPNDEHRPVHEGQRVEHDDTGEVEQEVAVDRGDLQGGEASQDAGRGGAPSLLG